MKLSPQISLKLSVFLGFSLIVLLMVVLAVVGLLRIAEANRQVEQIVSNSNVKTGLVHKMKDALRERKAVAQLLVLQQDPFKQNDAFLTLSAHGTAFSAARTALEAMPQSPEEKEIHERMRALAIKVQPFFSEAIDLAMKGNTSMAHSLVETQIESAQQSISAELEKLLELQKRESEVAVSDARKAFETTRLHMLVLGSFAIGLGLMIAPMVIRKANKQAQTLQQQAMFDALTKLPNRLLFVDRLQHTVLTARHEQRSFGLFVIDIDHFGKINSTFGSEIGDQVLQYMAACIQASLDEPDTLARMDGDQFAVLSMAVHDLDDAIVVAQNIRKAISEPFEISGRRLTITASVGAVMFPYHGDDPDALLLAADAAVSAAKETKRGYRIYSDDLARGGDDRVALLYELRQAVANGELILHYQPKIDINAGRVSGVEALVRWQHPAIGLLPPEQFIPMAESTGLIKPLTDWVLDTALRQYEEWYQAGVRLPMSVKVTAASIQDPDFPEQMAKRLKEYDVPASKFEIEIKETATISEPAQAMECIRKLNALGLQIAIGDFGTGNSSMTYLTELLVANIKIDKTLVKEMSVNHGRTMVVRTTVKLGHSLGLKVVAKGVENQESWNTLRGFGCDSAQGYYMSRPLPPVELMDWLHTSQWGVPVSSA
jgi:diguanylate cyclase (GGDEF)-like protein